MHSSKPPLSTLHAGELAPLTEPGLVVCDMCERTTSEPMRTYNSAKFELSDVFDKGGSGGNARRMHCGCVSTLTEHQESFYLTGYSSCAQS